LESPGLDLHPLPADLGDKAAVEFDGLFRPGRLNKAWSSALPAISQERELTYHEHPTGDLDERAVHFSFVVWKDPQSGDFRREEDDVVLRIRLGDTEQNQEPLLDLTDDFAADCNAGPRDALDDGSQRKAPLRTQHGH